MLPPAMHGRALQSPNEGDLPMTRRLTLIAAAGAAALVAAAGAVPAAAAAAHPAPNAYRQVNLVSNKPHVAALTDPDLVNAWGLSASPGTNASPGSPLWVSDNGTDRTT